MARDSLHVIHRIRRGPKFFTLALEFLSIHHAPTWNGSSAKFFEALNAPALQTLCIGEIQIKDLPTLKVLGVGNLLSFSVGDLLPQLGGEYHDGDIAGLLVKSVAHWNSLETFKILTAPDSTSHEFWEHLIRCLTSLSRESFELELPSETETPTENSGDDEGQ